MRKRKPQKKLKNFKNSNFVLFIIMEVLFLAYCLNKGTSIAQTYLLCLPGIVIWSLGVLYFTKFSRFGLLIVLMQHIGTVALIGIDFYTYKEVYKFLILTLFIGIVLYYFDIEFNEIGLFALILICFAILKVFGIDPENTGTINTVNLGFTTFQITEVIKLLTIILFGKIISSDKTDKKKLIWFGVTMAMNVAGFVYFRELGTLLMIMVVCYICILLALPKKYGLSITLSILAGIALASLYWFIAQKYLTLDNSILCRLFELINKVYNRILQSSTYRTDVSQHIGEAYRYVVLGGLFGSSEQLDLFARQTDFAFTNLIFNCGLIMGIIYSIGMSLLYMEGNYILSLQNPGFASRKAQGHSIIGILMLMEIMIRTFYLMMMNLAIFPICGIPLPFLSNGLSATLTLYYCLFLIGGNRSEKKVLVKTSFVQLSCNDVIYYRMHGNILKHHHNRKNEHKPEFFQKSKKFCMDQKLKISNMIDMSKLKLETNQEMKD